MKLIARALLSLALLFGTQAASAIPETYVFTSGSVTITATTSVTGTSVLGPVTVPMDGVFVEFDTAPISLVDFLFTVPQTPTLTLSGWGGYENLVIESGTLQPGVGFSTLFGANPAPDVYTFLAGPVDIDGVYSATDDDAILPDIMNLPISVTDSSLINGTVNTDLMTLELTGITLATLSGAQFGEAEDLNITADILFNGAIPEPGTAALLSLGVVSLAIRSRNQRTG